MTTNNPLINISQQNIQGKCDLKCDYSFKYNNSNSTATNNNFFIQISYDKSGIQPVTYNNVKYDVDVIMILQPSIHQFNGSSSDAEIIIGHTPLTGGPDLCVCVPVSLMGNNNTGSNVIDEIISLVATNAPNNGETVNLNLPDFTLQDIVPKKPFYNYSIQNYNFIVFDISDAISISSTTLNSLTSVIETVPAFYLNIFSENNQNPISLFYNAKGPNSNNNNNTENEIYISCNPTGNSENEENVSFEKATNNVTTFDISKITSNPYFIYVVYAFIFILLLIFLNGIIYNLSSGNIKFPSFTKKNSQS